MAELDGSSNYVAKYTQGTGVDEPLAMQRGGNVEYYQADGLVSITSLAGGGWPTSRFVDVCHGLSRPKVCFSFKPYPR